MNPAVDDRIDGGSSLLSTTVNDLWVPKNIIWVTSNCSLEEALKDMKENNILSLPVADEATGIWNGQVDMLDIAVFIIASFPITEGSILTNQKIAQLERQSREFTQNTKMSTLLNFVHTSFRPELAVPISVPPSAPLIDLVNLFSRSVHRVPVVENHSIMNLITQSDVIRYLAQNLYLLGNKGSRTIAQLGLGRNSCRFARMDLPVHQTLAFMANFKMYAVPILDMNGKLCGTFSASDLRRLVPFDWTQLLLSLSQFLTKNHVKSLYPLSCKPTDTLEYVLLKLAATKVHRLWCVDDSNNLLGVVSLTDVMRPLLGLEPMEVEQNPTRSHIQIQ